MTEIFSASGPFGHLEAGHSAVSDQPPLVWDAFPSRPCHRPPARRIVASRVRGAASPATDLLELGAKRLRKRPSVDKAPLSGSAASDDAWTQLSRQPVPLAQPPSPPRVRPRNPCRLTGRQSGPNPTRPPKSGNCSSSACCVCLVLTRTPNFPYIRDIREALGPGSRQHRSQPRPLLKGVEGAVEHAAWL